MKKTPVLLLLPLLLSGMASCSISSVNASFSGTLPQKVKIGQTINFANYLSYDVGTEVSLTYSTATKKDVSYPSLYFQTSEVGEHAFSFTFVRQGKNKTLDCTLQVVPNAPTLTEATNAVFRSKGQKASVEDLISESGIDALPFGYVDVAFTGLTYYEQYETELVRLQDGSGQGVYTKLSGSEKEFVFSECGKYVFDLIASNSEGTATASLQVSVADNLPSSLPGLALKGAIPGNEANLLQLMRSSSPSSLSYALFDEKIVMEHGYDYSLACEFVGKGAPQLLLLSDALHAKKYSGHGYFLSLEEDSKGQFGIYGQDRFNSQNLSPKRGSGWTFSRASLLEGSRYRWVVHFRKTAQLDGSFRLAVSSQLFRQGSLERTYDWVSVPADYPEDGAYFGFAGSGIDDVTFLYSPLAKEAL